MNPITELVDDSFIFIVGISVILLVGITAAMIYFVFRYSEKNNPKPDQSITGSTTLEILWTVIPLLLVLAMFFYGYAGFKEMRNVPPNAMVVKVTGKMWFWHFEYENKKTSDTLLYLPADKDVKFELQSVDVNHSFYVPAFRVKEDCIPGRTNYMWFHTSQVGTYDIECAEYCGLNHSYMLGKVIVLPESEYLAWVNKVDTVKKVDSVKTDSLKTVLPKTDSLKTTLTKTDTTKAPVNRKDTTRTVKKDSVMRKENK
ncbi:cytochrome c oxidase subunit II [Methylococcales bacterium]|nr:cytochrome c oxidase subunit II [Methylococcales bacterium]